MENRVICSLAIKAMENAYAPYSGCRVGAALEAEDGDVFTGCNVENDSFGATICAERNAVCAAVNAGKRRFTKLAVAGGKDGLLEGVFPPCGICLQVLSEFCEPNMPVLLVSSQTDYSETTLGALLPMAFHLDKGE